MHKRFEHSIGTCHLALKQMKRLQRSQPELGISDRDVRNVAIAGLCHDLGHGPFSHTFDSLIAEHQMTSQGLPADQCWHHEVASVMMLHDILESHPGLRKQVSLAEEKLISDLIMGNSNERQWICEIISNSRNGIDVDKFDYMMRDTQKANMNFSSFNQDKVMRGARVINNQICYPEKDAYELKKLFDSRYNLYKDCYLHRVTQAYECLLFDILKAAWGTLDLISAITDPCKYVELDDSILHEIRLSTSPEMELARQLLARFDSRHHYSFVAEKVLTKKIKVSAQEVCQYKRPQDSLSEDDIRIKQFNINMGMKEVNPLAHVSFYKTCDQGKAIELVHKSMNEISTMMPERF